MPKIHFKVSTCLGRLGAMQKEFSPWLVWLGRLKHLSIDWEVMGLIPSQDSVKYTICWCPAPLSPEPFSPRAPIWPLAVAQLAKPGVPSSSPYLNPSCHCFLPCSEPWILIVINAKKLKRKRNSQGSHKDKYDCSLPQNCFESKRMFHVREIKKNAKQTTKNPQCNIKKGKHPCSFLPVPVCMWKV